MNSVKKTRELDLCVSCEICASVCPNHAIIMEYQSGQFLPKINETECNSCGICLKICPGINLDVKNTGYFEDLLGCNLESYIAYSKNSEIRKESTSGGLITSLIVELIRKKKFDIAFVLNFDNFSHRLEPATTTDEVINAAKSKYIPASVYEIIKALEKKDNRKYVIVGTSCQICGIKNFIKEYDIKESNLLFLGLFCDRTLNFNILRYFEDTYAKLREDLVKLDYRNKELNGYPGDCKLYFDSGRSLFVNRNVRLQLKEYFQLNRCLFCHDKLNRLVDISFGDCYLKTKMDKEGKSSVIIRTKKGKKIFDDFSYLFELESISVNKIAESQNLSEKKQNLDFARKYLKCKTPKVSKKLSKLQKHMKWGKNYNKNKIRFDILIKIYKKNLKVFEKVILLSLRVIKDTFIRCETERDNKKENIIVVGGGLINKGAQAMVFKTVDQLRRRFANKNIYLFFATDQELKDFYNFDILPWSDQIKIGLLHFKQRKDTKKFENIIKNTSFFIDISGYALSSQFSFYHTINYLFNIMIAKKYSVPYYIFPQSIGPFDYKLKYKIILYPLMKLYLNYPEKIYVREEAGLKQVSKFSKSNVEKAYDIVLNFDEYKLKNIYEKNIFLRNIKIESNSVGIIPNQKIFIRTDENNIYMKYKSLIKDLTNAGKTVYIFRHSEEDLEICKKIKSYFPHKRNVKLISYELTCIELEKVIRQFDFIIASRYHSIIHAYKNGVPALVIGWATKYFELTKTFNQSEYLFDIRKNMDKKLNIKLYKLIKEYKKEREKILNSMNGLKRRNPFDDLT